jgi:hypothetical protein
VKGNGGGSNPGRASAMAPLFLIFRCTDASRLEEIQCTSPFSPILRPIQNVADVPIKDPAVARSGNIQNREGWRDERTIIAASTTIGEKNNMEESIAARPTSPRGDRNIRNKDWKNPMFSNAHRHCYSACNVLQAHPAILADLSHGTAG